MKAGAAHHGVKLILINHNWSDQLTYAISIPQTSNCNNLFLLIADSNKIIEIIG